MKLEVGKRYIFNVEKIVSLQSDNFFILKGPDDKRYLLNCNDYIDYEITPGISVDCRLDKINCKGEVFLEPLHPYYKENCIYDFKISYSGKRVDKGGDSVDVIIALDRYGREIVIPKSFFCEEIPGSGESVSLKIKQIIKGTIMVFDHSIPHGSLKEEESDLFNFFLVGESVGLDGREYIIVENEEKEQFVLPKEYYTHYHLENYKSFQGRYVRYKEGDEVTVEPKHPHFEKDAKYLLTIRSIINIAQGIESIVMVEDDYGFTHKVNTNKDYTVGAKLWFKVIKMRKGWPMLAEV